MQTDSMTPPPLPPDLIDVRGIVGWPGYAIGHDGIELSVWTCWQKNGCKLSRMSLRWKRMAPCANSSGYLLIGVRRNGQKTTPRLHRLVATSFIGPCPDGMQACHRDGNKLNNLPSNLKWDTPLNNIRDKAIHGTQCKGANHGSAKLAEADVLAIFAMIDEDNLTQGEIGEIYGVSSYTISDIATGRNWKHLRKVAYRPEELR